MAGNQNAWSTLRIVTSSIGVLAGLAASLSFYFVFHAYEAAIWALVSAVFAASALFLAVGEKRGDLPSWLSVKSLNKIEVLGFTVMAIGLSCFAWYLFKGAYYHIPMMPAEHSAYIVSVWAFMTAKWGMALFFFARAAAKRMIQEGENQGLLET